jgi:endonuclease YncB( thermonuclease family)
MYNYFWEENKIFFAIIIGALIIGGFVFIPCLPVRQGMKTVDVVIAPKTAAPFSAQNSSAKAQLSQSSNSSAVCGAANNTIVTKVIDGDTVVVEGGYHVRLLGMDADEKGYPCYEPAKIRLEALVLGKQVILEKDKTDLDQYGRCLRYIFLGSTNVDAQLVKEGLAVARFYADVKYQAEIKNAEQQAIVGKIGCKWQ